MRIYTEGAPVVLNIVTTDLNGQPAAPSVVEAWLNDEYGVKIADLTGITSGLGSIEVMIPAIHNVISGSDTDLGVRSLWVEYTVDGVQKSVLTTYGLEREQALRVCVNSFQTLARAQVEAARMINLDAFNTEADEDRQKAALIEAFSRIVNLRLTYETTINNMTRWFNLDASIWDGFTEDAFNTQLPSRLRRALIQAQLVEANEILEGNVMARKLSAGIQSETIGESSVTFKNSAVAAAGVSSFAMSILAPFLDRTIRLARA